MLFQYSINQIHYKNKNLKKYKKYERFKNNIKRISIREY